MQPPTFFKHYIISNTIEGYLLSNGFQAKIYPWLEDRPMKARCFKGGYFKSSLKWTLPLIGIRFKIAEAGPRQPGWPGGMVTLFFCWTKISFWQKRPFCFWKSAATCPDASFVPQAIHYSKSWKASGKAFSRALENQKTKFPLRCPPWRRLLENLNIAQFLAPSFWNRCEGPVKTSSSLC